MWEGSHCETGMHDANALAFIAQNGKSCLQTLAIELIDH